MPDSPLRPDRLVARPELLRRLKHSGIARLALVVAPAGYGKTTLLSEWAAGEARPMSRVWHTLVEADNNPTHLLAGLIADVRSALPDPSALPAVDATQSSLSYPLSLIFRYAAEITHQDWLLLLDDYQLITNSAVHQALDSLLNLPTWPVHLVMASRTLPPLTSIARLRVEGRLLELDEQDLRFTPAEAADLFEASGLHLTAEELSQVTARTEGWAAALRLVCQAAQRETGTDVSIILNHVSDESHLFDYLAGQVLNHQPAEVQRFLCRTALLPYLDVDLCNAFLGSHEASAVLDTLERNRLFISRLGERPRCRYRYHALFQEFLGRCLEQAEGAQAVREWHRRAARCFRERLVSASTDQPTDDYNAVINHLLAAQDWTSAAEAIETVTSPLDWGQITLMEIWFDRLPREVLVTRPRLLMALGNLRERQCRWSEALQALTQAEQLLRAEGELSDKVRVLRMQGWIHLRQGRYAEARALGYQALAHLLRVPTPDLSGANLPELVEAVLEKSDWSQDATGSQLPPALLWLQAWTYALLNACDSETDQVEGTEKNLQRVLGLFRKLGDRQWEARTLNAMAMNVYYAQGRLAEALQANQMSLRINEERGSHEVCWPLCGLGQTRWLQGDYESARVTLARLLELADAHQDRFWQGYALPLSGHVHREQSNRPAARACYEEALQLGQELQEPTILFEPRWGLAMLALDEGNLREAQRYGEIALQQMRAIGYRWWEGRALTVLGLVMDRRGDVSQAEVNFCEAASLFQKLGTQYDLALVDLYLADLYRRDGRNEEMLIRLGRCLSLSQRYDLDFIFTVRERIRAIPLLVTALAVASKATPISEVVRLLNLMGQEVVTPLLSLLEAGPAKTRLQEQVIQLLGEVGDERAVPVLDRLRRHRPLQFVAQAALHRIAERPAPTLHVSALGSFQVLRGSLPIPIEAWQQRRKTRLLLLYLLTQRHRQVSRDELLEALWPDLAPESAGAAFNTTSSDLRKLLEPYLGKGMPSRYIAREGDCYSFNMTSQVWYDVQAFEQAVQTPKPIAHSALDLYRGDFLPEEPYLDWVVRERERLRSLYLNTLMGLLDQQVRQGLWHEGIDLARRILEHESWLEEVWRSMMTCYARLGRRSEALQAYLSCERSLRQELDVVPSPETRALYEQLKA